MGYAHEEFDYWYWDLVDKKIIKSRDVVFLEDQTIKDFEKIEKLKSITRNYVDLDPVPPTMVHNDNEENIQKDDDSTVDEPILDNDMPDQYTEQVPPEPLVEP